jgi:hypothetical protein
MDPHQKIKEMCPFCEQEVLEVLWWPCAIIRKLNEKLEKWRFKHNMLFILKSEIEI